MKTIAEQLADLKATREAHQKRMMEIAQKSIDENRSMNDAEAEEFETVEAEVKTLDADISRFSRLETIQKANATSAATAAQSAAQTTAQSATGGVQVKNTEKLAPGISFARMARCLALAHIEHRDPVQIAQRVYPGDDRVAQALIKAAVPAANTGNAGWASNLINEGGIAFADFVEYLRPRTLLGQVSDRLRPIPIDTPVLIQGSGGSAAWVAEGSAKPLTQWSYTRAKLAPLKVAAIAAITKETLMRASPAADGLLRDELTRAIGSTIDTTFIDPDAAAVSGESPASILNGVTPLTLSGGTTVADIRCDIATFLTEFADNNLSIAGAFWVMPERVAIALSLIANEIGAVAFPGITPNGGTFAGLPVFVSNFVPTVTEGSVVALVRGDEIFLADEGGIMVSMSDQASLIMDNAPNGSSVTPTAATMVSMWQTNSVAVLVERFLNFSRRRDESVAWGHVTWTACPTS